MILITVFIMRFIAVLSKDSQLAKKHGGRREGSHYKVPIWGAFFITGWFSFFFSGTEMCFDRSSLNLCSSPSVLDHSQSRSLFPGGKRQNYMNTSSKWSLSPSSIAKRQKLNIINLATSSSPSSVSSSSSSQPHLTMWDTSLQITLVDARLQQHLRQAHFIVYISTIQHLTSTTGINIAFLHLSSSTSLPSTTSTPFPQLIKELKWLVSWISSQSVKTQYKRYCFTNVVWHLWKTIGPLAPNNWSWSKIQGSWCYIVISPV